MECISPILSNTAKFGRVLLPCGKCVPCIQRKGRDWFVRLSLEVKYFKGSAYFVTLTYNDSNIPVDYHLENDFEAPEYTFDKEYIQKFIKRLRKALKCELRYFLVAERGELHGRPHYHAIFLVDMPKLEFYNLLVDKWKNEDKEDMGFVDIADVNNKRLCYITDYMLCKEETNQFRLMSKGIGKKYTEKKTFVRYHHKTLDGLVRINDINYPMPRYMRGKIHTKMENQIIGKKLSQKALDGIEDRDARYVNLLSSVKFKKQKRQTNSNKKYFKMKKNEKSTI